MPMWSFTATAVSPSVSVPTIPSVSQSVIRYVMTDHNLLYLTHLTTHLRQPHGDLNHQVISLPRISRMNTR